ncbi:hypothetical protein BS78_K236900 [Paspalum vaginatum]|uniref:Uncharacterized protein n=1 Tax=Paspalum vaginatum TaxID=158149 RepID=A0A9W7XEC9_9POAL|nr:hypothetical protein BS78_K236900 [Paspalum vaginatum]
MATRAEGVEGFPSILDEMLWRGNFSYRPEYAVYATGRGPGLVDYVATLFVPKCLVEGVIEPHHFVAVGTSVDMAIRAMAYKAIGVLWSEVVELDHCPFSHFPIQSPEQGVNSFEMVFGDATLYERWMSKLVQALDRMIRCLTYELGQTRSCYNHLQRSVEPFVRMGLGNLVLYGAADGTPYELAPPSFHYQPVHGAWVEQTSIGQAHASVGLRVRQFANTPWTPRNLLGAEPINLCHPENPQDMGSLRHHLLHEFPLNFVRAPYGGLNADGDDEDE